MKLIETKCPNCGAEMKVDLEQKKAVCAFCGASLIVDDESQNLLINNGEEFGYQFEKGRQRAQGESSDNYTPVSNAPAPQKRKTWLWVLGWVFIFPLPLTLIFLKKPNMNNKTKYGIIAASWAVYILLAIIGAASGSTNNKAPEAQAVYSQPTTIAETTIDNTTTPSTVETTVPKATEEPTEISTEVFTEASTEAPTESPTPAVAEFPITFTNYTNFVEAGSNASVTIQGKPNTEYRIHVIYDSGESQASGLESKISDANGFVKWEWKVGPKTTPGLHAIRVEGGGAENSVQFEVLEEIN